MLAGDVQTAAVVCNCDIFFLLVWMATEAVNFTAVISQKYRVELLPIFRGRTVVVGTYLLSCVYFRHEAVDLPTTYLPVIIQPTNRLGPDLQTCMSDVREVKLCIVGARESAFDIPRRDEKN